MDIRRILAFILLFLAIILIIAVPLWLFTPLGQIVPGLGLSQDDPPLEPLSFQRIPRATPQAVLTSSGTPGQFSASEVLLMDADTGNILYEKNGEVPVPMASTTKIMTALLAIQAGKPDQVITVGNDAPLEVSENNGSSAYLVAGAKIKLQDLLYALLLPSGDDAAVAIADGIAGSVPNFVQIMNVEAKKLHLYSTHYDNPDGLQPTDSQGNPILDRHYTTPYDLARLTRYALRLPLFDQIVSTPSYTPPTGTSLVSTWKNTNKLLGVYPGILGVKTGTTPQAGECLVFAAKRNGHTLIGVVLHATTDASRFEDARTLLDWGFGLPVQVPQL